MTKRVYKDSRDKKISGVCSGIAKFFALDPTLIRLAWVLFCALGGSGVLAYIVCALVIPDEPGAIED